MALNRSDKSRILRRYFPGMTRNSEMSTEPKDGKVRQKGLTRINSSDRIALPLRPMFPGWPKLGL